MIFSLHNFGPQKLDDLKSALGKMGIQIPYMFQANSNRKSTELKIIKKQNYDEVFGKNVQKISQKKVTLDNIIELLDEFTEFTIEINQGGFATKNYSNNIQTEFNILVSSFKVESIKSSIDENIRNYVISLLFKKFIIHKNSFEAIKWINIKSLFKKS